MTYRRKLHTDRATAGDQNVLGYAAAMQDGVRVADPGDFERNIFRPPRSRSGRNKDCSGTQLALLAVRSSHNDATVRTKSSGAFDVVDVVLCDVLRRHLLQQLAHLPGPLANCIGDDLRRRRHTQTVHVAFAESRKIECRFAESLRRCATSRRYCSTWTSSLDHRRAVPEERRQLGSAFPSRTRPDSHKVICLSHCKVLFSSRQVGCRGSSCSEKRRKYFSPTQHPL